MPITYDEPDPEKERVLPRLHRDPEAAESCGLWGWVRMGGGLGRGQNVGELVPLRRRCGGL